MVHMPVNVHTQYSSYKQVLEKEGIDTPDFMVEFIKFYEHYKGCIYFDIHDGYYKPKEGSNA